MGQRLIINISNGEDIIATSYYHWSGYTDSAFELCEIISERMQNDEYLSISDNNEHLEQIKKAVDLLSSTGARLQKDEKRYANAKYLGVFVSLPFATNRKDGMIAISKDCIIDLNQWGEAFVKIDLNSGDIEFEVWNYDEDIEEFRNWYQIEENEEIPEISIHPEHLKYSNLKEFRQEISNLDYFLYDGIIYSKIQ